AEGDARTAAAAGGGRTGVVLAARSAAINAARSGARPGTAHRRAYHGGIEHIFTAPPERPWHGAGTHLSTAFAGSAAQSLWKTDRGDGLAVCRLPFAVCRLPFAVCRSLFPV